MSGALRRFNQGVRRISSFVVVASRAFRLSALLVCGFLLSAVEGARAQNTGLKPFVECVEVDQEHGTMRAFFGYVSTNPAPINIKAGSSNMFFPSPQNRGQREVFLPGLHPRNFSVTNNYWVTPSIIWLLDTRTAEANLHSPRCDGSNSAGQLRFESLNYYVNEGGGAASITVSRTNGKRGAVSVNFSTFGGTADTGSDYSAASGMLHFADGEVLKTFTVPILSDTLPEGDETVILKLKDPTSGATLYPSADQAVLTIEAGRRFSNPTSIVRYNENFDIVKSLPVPVRDYPSNITVAGLGGTISKLRVTLHEFVTLTPHNTDILLVGPSGQKLILMSDAGRDLTSLNTPFIGTLTFDDAATSVLPSDSKFTPGNYKPTNHGGDDSFPAPAPAGSYQSPAPAGTSTLASVFNGADPNGTWSLYLLSPTDGTSIVNGWTLNVETVSCDSVSIGPEQLPAAITGAGYNIQLTATGGTAPYSFSLKGGTLPSGLSLSSDGALSGIPAQAGSFDLNILVTDFNGCAEAREYTLISEQVVNASPSFTKGPDQSVTINAGAQTIHNWATNISPGAPGESGQSLSFIVTNDNNALFLVQPALDSAGTLTFTPADNASGFATVAVILKDDGGTANGGKDTSTEKIFRITVDCVANNIVTNSNDSGAGSLRDIIINACPGSTITFDMNQVTSPITLTNGELSINKDLTIQGPATQGLTISGNNTDANPNKRSRIFSIGLGRTVGISNLTIAEGEAYFGGGIYNLGNLTITNSTLTGNKAVGTIAGGGAIGSESGSLIIVNSTISGNSSDGMGGGLLNYGTSSATLTSVTITNNRADSDGSDGVNAATGIGGGIGQMGNNPVTLRNTIVAGNFNDAEPGMTPDDIHGMADSSSSFNLIGTGGSGGLTGGGANGNQVNVAYTGLSALADNGGFTKTHLLLPGSPAIDAGDPAFTPPPGIDQRGFTRVMGGHLDVGAVEVNYAISATAGTPQSAVLSTAFPTTLLATVKESNIARSGISVTFTADSSVGASGTFSSSSTVITDNNGVATAPAFTANDTAGSYNVTASLTGGSPSTTFALTNTPTQAQIILGNLVQIYDGSQKPVSITTVPTGLTVVITYDGSTTAPTNVKPGGYAVVATINDANYQGTATATLTINNTGQTITFDALPNRTFGDPEFSVAASASSGLMVSFSASGQCTVSGNVIHITGAGSCTLTASQGGDGNHYAATSVQQSFNINKAGTTSTINVSDATYDGNPHGGTATVYGTGGLSQSLTVIYTGRNATTYGPSTVPPTNAGDYTSSATFSGDANYQGSSDSKDFQIAKADQVITFNALPNKTFADSDFKLSAAASSGLSVNFAADGQCSVTGDTVHITGAGSCTITASQTGNSNFNKATDMLQTFQIAKASQTITFSPLENRPFGSAPLAVSATGGASGNAITFNSQTPAVCAVSGTTVTILAAGTCTISASQAGNSNYAAAPDVDQSFNVAKAATTTALASSINPSSLGQEVTITAMVTGAPGVPTGTVQVFIDGTSQGTPQALDSGGAAEMSISSLTAGNHTITADYSGDANFSPSTGTLAGGITVNIPTGISINDVSLMEGDSGTQSFDFAVTLATPSNLTVKVDFTTADGTATAGSDYQPASDTLTFAPGDLSKTITVRVNGDTVNEPNKTFFVNLSNPVNATISKNQGAGTLVNDDAPGVHLSSDNYTFSEGAGHGYIIVTRTGDLSSAISVDYQTGDQSEATPCQTNNTGFASERCDYAMTSGMLRFTAGEMSKQIQLPLVNDGYVEGPEVFTIKLQNPVGTALDSLSQATITIVDDDTTPTTGAQNPYLNNNFFVRMNYLDLLGREPDTNGFTDWVSALNDCGLEKGFLGAPKNCDRAHVAHGFFGSTEFTDTGFLIYRMYEIGMGRLPRYAEFVPDMATLSGFSIPDNIRQQNLQDYLQQFGNKQEFTNRFSDALQPSQATTLIQKLEQSAGITLPETATTRVGQPQQYGRDELIQKRASGEFTIGQTLKAFAEQQLVYDKYFPRGQVTMLYLAYLRRDPDLNDPNLVGWTDWVDVFTNGRPSEGIAPRDIHHLIFGFIYSEEYRKRFGAP